MFAGEQAMFANTADFRNQLQASPGFTSSMFIARQHGGPTESDNLALACSFCNFHKGPNIASLDPEGGMLVPLFHPRRDDWSEHFTWAGTTIIGLTPTGRATVHLLGMNDWQRVELRENLQALGEPFAG